jgi:hypothetical protein
MIAFVIQLITFIQNLLPGPIEGKYKKRVNIRNEHEEMQSA